MRFAIPLFICCALCLPGCNVGGGVMSKLQGPAVHHAQYEPLKQPLAVVVENFAHGSGGRLDTDQIASFLSAELKEHNVAPVVEPGKVYELRVENPTQYHSLSIAGIGRSVGAQQVLYVDVQSYEIEGPEGSESMKGSISGRIKVVDVFTGQSRWPNDSEGGYPFEYATPWLNRTHENSDIAMTEKLDRSVADHIARMLYTWTEDE